MRTAVVAGGLGSRMGDRSRELPKPMLEVLGKPMLEHLIIWLVSSGRAEIGLCLGYRAQTVRDYFGDGSKWGARLDYQIEESPRGTAGCVRDFAGNSSEDVLVVYGDLFVAMDLRLFLKFHEARPAAAASVVLFKTDHPQDSDLARLKDERIEGFYRDETAVPSEHWAAAAIWAVRRPLLDLIPKDRPSDFGRDIFPEAISRGLRLSGYATAETLADLGTPERLSGFAGRNR